MQKYAFRSGYFNSFYFFIFISQNIFSERKIYSVVVWRKSVHKQPRFGHFHDKFQPFWSMGIMTKLFQTQFLQFIFFFFSISDRMIFMNQKEHSMVVWRKSVHKQPRFGHFHAKFWPFWSMGIMTFRPIFFNSFYFFVLISSNDYCESNRTFCGDLEEIGL